MAALADVARHGGEYPELFGLPQADEPEDPGPDYLPAVRAQAKVALVEHGAHLQTASTSFLERVIQTENA